MDSELEAWFQGALAEARREWPDLGVAEEEFRSHVESKIATLPDRAAYRKLRTTDLYFAFACSKQDEAAFVAFEDRYVPKLTRALAQLRIADATVEDLKGALVEMLFFGKEGTHPLIADYSGRGDLGGWLRSITVRLGFKAKKKQGREVEAEPVLEVLATESNPELVYLRQAHAAAFEEAIGQALAGLETRERNLLRQHYLDGLNIDDLGKLYRIHRATAARQIAAARDKVLDAVKRTLATKMSPSELESFLRMTRRDLGLRISTYLRSSH